MAEISDFDQRMKQARARAEYELGDPEWADIIVQAYMHPERDAEILAEELA